jgi:hypothetical protein
MSPHLPISCTLLTQCGGIRAHTMEGVRDSDKTKTTATLEMYIFILQKLIRVNNNRELDFNSYTALIYTSILRRQESFPSFLRSYNYAMNSYGANVKLSLSKK